MKFKIMAILMVGLLLLNGCGEASEIPAKNSPFDAKKHDEDTYDLLH